MTYGMEVTGTASKAAHPDVRKIGPADLKAALLKGLADFNAKPSHVFFIYLIYPFVALLMARLALGYDILPLIFPIFAGFTLLGPLAATGFYEISRRREQGLDTSWRHAFQVLLGPANRGLAMLGVLLLAIWAAWLGAAQVIYEVFFGATVPESVAAFVRQVFFTPAGWKLIVIGSGVGLLFAAAVLSFSVVSFPMLLDRKGRVLEAVGTSVKVVLVNPMVMLLWGIIISAGLLIGTLPFFAGLAVVLPVLGHSTWHIYRLTVADDGSQDDPSGLN